jgi:outer membrane murein-binding lipoprotein Lpp
MSSINCKAIKKAKQLLKDRHVGIIFLHVFLCKLYEMSKLPINRRWMMLNRNLIRIGWVVVSCVLLTGCNSSSDVDESKTQHKVNNVSNKLNIMHKNKNGVVEKDGKVGNDGVVNDKESRKMNNK